MDYTVRTTDDHELVLTLVGKSFHMRRTATSSLLTLRHMIRTRAYFDFNVVLRTKDQVDFALGVSYHTQLPPTIAIDGPCLYIADYYFDLETNYTECLDFIDSWYRESKKLDRDAGWNSLGSKRPLHRVNEFTITPHRGGVSVARGTNTAEYITTDWLPMQAFDLLADAINTYAEGCLPVSTTASGYTLEVKNRYRNGLDLIISRCDIIRLPNISQPNVWELFIGNEVLYKAREQVRDFTSRFKSLRV